MDDKTKLILIGKKLKKIRGGVLDLDTKEITSSDDLINKIDGDKKELSYEKFAMRIGYSKAYVVKTEKGEVEKINYTYLKNVCDEFCINYNWLLSEEDSKLDYDHDRILKKLNASVFNIEIYKEYYDATINNVNCMLNIIRKDLGCDLKFANEYNIERLDLDKLENERKQLTTQLVSKIETVGIVNIILENESYPKSFAEIKEYLSKIRSFLHNIPLFVNDLVARLDFIKKMSQKPTRDSKQEKITDEYRNNLKKCNLLADIYIDSIGKAIENNMESEIRKIHLETTKSLSVDKCLEELRSIDRKRILKSINL